MNGVDVRGSRFSPGPLKTNKTPQSHAWVWALTACLQKPPRRADTSKPCFRDPRNIPTSKSRTMISHNTLYSLANTLGILAMVTAVGYHFVAVNERYLAGGEEKKSKKN
ncbi:hypothetical protein Hypma_009428 [Hypsizygus marmoreus]|uniref:Uncharacterized protein n=1 Tax=Hypsizygus marmoreus TaxID=39966 RepID=A0A369JTB3_HYPMA|nr:hypothetical protein Hypma_009428 [Hypsizygus marmoreus]